MGQDYSSGPDHGQIDKTRWSMVLEAVQSRAPRKPWLSYAGSIGVRCTALPGDVVARLRMPKTWCKVFLNV